MQTQTNSFSSPQSQPRTYKARRLHEALALVRRELGPDAIIVGTRKVAGRDFGLLGGTLFEVTATAGASAEPAPTRVDPTAGTSRVGHRAAYGAAGAATFADDALHAAPAPRPMVDVAERARQIVQARTRLQDNVVAPARAPRSMNAQLESAARPDLVGLRRRLVSQLVPHDLADQLIERIPADANGANALAALRRRVHAFMGPTVPLVRSGSRVAMFVGPTGVGKTTTIAKIATHATLVEGRRVVLIGLDDHRLGAQAHLRAWGDLIDVPTLSAAEHGGLRGALRRAAGADLVLVDTGGSPLRGGQSTISALACELEEADEEVSTHLCFAAATRTEELERILHMHRALRAHALIATKVDEAAVLGALLSAREFARVPYSYLTTGQTVPDDIEAATTAQLVNLVLGDTP